ncbi:hypothetical protein CA11_22050 [Gimesia maris]|uniref:carboxypeptidase-like regulatory domain-containing protein n=1 Tax=Gimesia maris TaxID=122 RepID=UPI00118ADEA6|nr:carboxypeptidase-like regulatory domain-containing protein [Gimesia maris]QDT78866.1 hypothetical protein Mal35_23170 [Gimesia maris]QDU14399.1 hypothetical protein CA11_22050 [Gimesia maris]|tara:strand:- start:65167 stop:65610 length:444 start_codon:yes stop_codon:yes gene_type:complete
MKLKTESLWTITLLALSFSLAGCGGGVDDQPELGQVKGTVTMDGSPLAGVSVTFSPDSGRPATGKTDVAGNYELIYIRNTPGCKLGHNTVMISNSGEEDEMEMEGDDAVMPTTTEENEIPAKYNSKTTLEADVQPGENTFNFDLKKK